ncbi:MAG: hypothetical protein M1835_000487 [Candelina submexicana]|nr:MAG: hypothetical protein M1835_000487 [Candelina submexicana]
MATIHSTRDRPVMGRKMMQRMLELEKQSQVYLNQVISYRPFAKRNKISAAHASSPGDSLGCPQHMDILLSDYSQQNRSRSSPPDARVEPASPTRTVNARSVQHPEPSQEIIQRRRPAMAERPMSVPALSVTIPPPKSSTDSTSNSQQEGEAEAQIDGSPRSSVCVSPSWSDFGGKKKKKEKKKKEQERKELDKQLKKEQEKNTKSEKAAKRLSKKPPAPSKDKAPKPLVRAITAPPETLHSQSVRQVEQPELPTTPSNDGAPRPRRPPPAVLLPKDDYVDESHQEYVGRAKSHAGVVSAPNFQGEPYRRVSAEAAPQIPRLPLMSSNWSNPGTPEESSSEDDDNELDHGARAHPFTRNPSSDSRNSGHQESAGILKNSVPLRSVQLVSRSGPVRSVTWGDMSEAQEQGNLGGTQLSKSHTSPALARDGSSSSSSSISSPSTPVAGTYARSSVEITHDGRSHGPPDAKKSLFQQSITNSSNRLSTALGDAFLGKKRDRTKGGYQYPTLTQEALEELAKRQSVEVELGTDTTQLRKVPFRQSLDEYSNDSGPPLNVQIPSKTSGHKRRTSYVQNQRLHYQEYQLAGFEDEMKVAFATQGPLPDTFDDEDEQRFLPGPPKSPQASKPRPESRGRGKTAVHKDHNAKSTGGHAQPDQYHTFLKDHSKIEEQKIESQILLHARDISPTKAPKSFLGMHRPSVGSPKRSTASEKPVAIQGADESTLPKSTVSPVSPATVAMVSKISKAERSTVHPTATSGATISSAPRPVSSSASPAKSKPTVSLVKDDGQANRSSDGSSTPTASKLQAQHRPSSRDTNKNLPQLPKRSLSDGDGDVDTDGDSHQSGSIKSIDAALPQSNGEGVAGTTRPFPEIIVEGIDGDGVGRKTSIKRPKSNPLLHTTAQVQDLSFLPELKHQSLVKPEKARRVSPNGSIASTAPSIGNGSDKSGQTSPPQFPLPSPPSTRPSSDDGASLPVGASSTNYLGVRPQSYQGGSLLRPSASPRRRSAMNPMGSQSGSEAAKQLKPLAKMFVICCKCQFWHDLPSKVYEAMAKPRRILEDEVDGATEGNVETRVKCQWCNHFMSTSCCAGWTTVVYLHERHH